MKLVHWPLMGGLLHLVQRGEDWAGPNVTAHPATASVAYQSHTQNFIHRIEIGSYIKEIIRGKLN